MKPEDSISYIAVVVIAVSLFFIGTELTGFATTDTGLVNVTIDTSASIVFDASYDIIDFGNGSTNGSAAIIDSTGNTNGYWTGGAPSDQGLILENNGNINVSFTLVANKTADSFLGGTGPQFELLVSDNESTSCGDTANFTSWQPINLTVQQACDNFGYNDTIDSVRIDARLTIPTNAGGAKTVGVTATATAV